MIKFTLCSKRATVFAYVIKGDISQLSDHYDAIVNCSNLSLSGSENQKAYWMFSGRKNVDTAIHAAAGPALLAACLSIPEIKNGVRCEIGQCKSTPACGKIKSKYIIHTVGPRDGDSPDRTYDLLRSSYYSTFYEAQRLQLKSIAVPAISCGIGNIPPHMSARACLQSLRDTLVGNTQVDATVSQLSNLTFCMYEDKTYWAWVKALQQSQDWQESE